MNMQDEYLHLYQSLDAINDELKTIPPGWIEKKMIHGITYEYYRYMLNGKRFYGGTENIEELKQQFQKRDHLLEQKKQLKEKMSSCREILKKQGVNPAALIRQYRKAQKQQLTQMQMVQQEKAKTFSKRHPENYGFRTLRGEWVSSKSEMMIADALFRNHIHYEYEKAIYYNGVEIHPDFTIIFNGKTYYWEHNGLMTNAEYRKSWEWRKSIYDALGIYQFVNLIVTSETRDCPLTQGQIDNIIKIYFTADS